MRNDNLLLTWEQAPGLNYLYFYGRTQTRFSAQIGQSSTPNKFVWIIFHEDFRGAVHGEEVPSVEEAKDAAQQWLRQRAKPDRA